MRSALAHASGVHTTYSMYVRIYLLSPGGIHIFLEVSDSCVNLRISAFALASSSSINTLNKLWPFLAYSSRSLQK